MSAKSAMKSKSIKAWTDLHDDSILLRFFKRLSDLERLVLAMEHTLQLHAKRIPILRNLQDRGCSACHLPYHPVGTCNKIIIIIVVFAIVIRNLYSKIYTVPLIQWHSRLGSVSSLTNSEVFRCLRN